MDENREKVDVRSRRREEEMFPLVVEYLEGSESQQSFCAARSVPLSVFSYWLRKYRSSERRAAEPGFVSVGLRGLSPEAVEVEFPGGQKLRFDRLPDVNYLKALLSS